MRERVRVVAGVAVIVWTTPRAALAHSAPCSSNESVTTVAIVTVLGLLVFRPWRSSGSFTARAGRWVLPALLASAVTVGACAPKTTPSPNRPLTSARLEITQPMPGETMPPSFTVTMNVIGARIVPPTVTGGQLRADEGHIHLTLDGKLISMAYGTSQDLKDLAPGPHTIQAELVAIDHAPFQNRVIAAVAFEVSGQASP